MRTDSQKILTRARELGFISIGLSIPGRPPYFEEFSSWLSGRNNAGMSWLERNVEIREDPSLLLKGCRTIISLAYPYPSKKIQTQDGLSVSRFSRPDQEDYHIRLKALCGELTKTIKDMHKGCKSRICVDSAPVMERSLAYSAGMGFIGKNNMLIIPGFGSYFYLAEILTTARLEYRPMEPMKGLCGSCSLCIDSCPTGALERPFCLNASKCLSYLTVEHKGAVHEDDGRKMGDCFFGCDRCQELCPFNGQEKQVDILLPSSEEFLGMDEEDFQERFGNTSFARAGLEKIKSNIRAMEIKRQS